MRDPNTGESKGFGFISYDCFEASDLAIECMNGQFLCNKQISVAYAFKKDSKHERHGDAAGLVFHFLCACHFPPERFNAAQNPLAKSRPNTYFAAAPGESVLPQPVPAMGMPPQPYPFAPPAAYPPAYPVQPPMGYPQTFAPMMGYPPAMPFMPPQPPGQCVSLVGSFDDTRIGGMYPPPPR